VSKPRRRGGRSGGGGRPQDHFGRRARTEGFAARSVYKLQEIDRRMKLFRAGQRVLDLGAFPGSWTQWAARRVGKGGRVLGLDVQSPPPGLPVNAEMREADVLTVTPEELGGSGAFDVVLSDMAPATTGHRSLDQMRSQELFMRALELARGVLAPGGAFVGKIFQSGDFPEAKKAVAASFEEARVIRPTATRAESFEVFLVGLRFRG
jgi:23S rRNA (uridine2552-2'-O)-methyltransferase